MCWNFMMKKTPLFENHLKRKAKMVPFAGYSMPLEFLGAKKEHLHVRSDVGLFDVSHMGEMRIQGDQALSFLSLILTNNIQELLEGQSQYTLMCNERGGILDDMILSCLQLEKDYLLCVNASNKEKIFKWLQENKKNYDIHVIDESDLYGQIAVQGPKAFSLLRKKLNIDHSLKRFYFQWISSSYGELFISRTGYTGEDGFEVLASKKQTSQLWDYLLDDENVIPIGIAARNTLRLEMKYPLYGEDINEKTFAHELGLSWACKNPSSFIGRQVLSQPLLRKWVGFEVIEPSGIPRHGYLVFSQENKKIGQVTSGIWSPSLNKMIGTAMVQKDFSHVGREILIQIHGNIVLSRVVSTPFYKV